MKKSSILPVKRGKAVWKYFSVILKNNEHQFSVCNKCKAEFKNKNTSVLKKHMAKCKSTPVKKEFSPDHKELEENNGNSNSDQEEGEGEDEEEESNEANETKMKDHLRGRRNGCAKEERDDTKEAADGVTSDKQVGYLKLL